MARMLTSFAHLSWNAEGKTTTKLDRKCYDQDADPGRLLFYKQSGTDKKIFKKYARIYFRIKV